MSVCLQHYKICMSAAFTTLPHHSMPRYQLKVKSSFYLNFKTPFSSLPLLKFPSNNSHMCCRYSPTIQSIKALDQRRVRKAKLYYLRDRNPKDYRVA